VQEERRLAALRMTPTESYRLHTVRIVMNPIGCGSMIGSGAADFLRSVGGRRPFGGHAAHIAPRLSSEVAANPFSGNYRNHLSEMPTTRPCGSRSIVGEVAVGTIIADRPPHRSVRALISAYGSYLG